VINASLGSPVNDLTLAAAAQYAWLHGVLLVAAAGNESGPSPDYPAVLPNVLSVSASDQNDRLYRFSNSGARVAAPGENSTTGLGGTYVSFLGTSSAAPVVSGIAALAFSLVPSATPAQVEQAIEASAVPIPGVASGRVDAYATLHTLAPRLASTQTPAPSQVQPQGGAPGTGTSVGARRTKVVTGTLRGGKNASVVIVTGAGLLGRRRRPAPVAAERFGSGWWRPDASPPPPAAPAARACAPRSARVRTDSSSARAAAGVWPLR